jgi:two-component system cell cycle sensor histidine kinase/response regulator CckA
MNIQKDEGKKHNNRITRHLFFGSFCLFFIIFIFLTVTFFNQGFTEFDILPLEQADDVGDLFIYTWDEDTVRSKIQVEITENSDSENKKSLHIFRENEPGYSGFVIELPSKFNFSPEDIIQIRIKNQTELLSFSLQLEESRTIYNNPEFWEYFLVIKERDWSQYNINLSSFELDPRSILNQKLDIQEIRKILFVFSPKSEIDLYIDTIQVYRKHFSSDIFVCTALLTLWLFSFLYWALKSPAKLDDFRFIAQWLKFGVYLLCGLLYVSNPNLYYYFQLFILISIIEFYLFCLCENKYLCAIFSVGSPFIIWLLIILYLPYNLEWLSLLGFAHCFPLIVKRPIRGMVISFVGSFLFLSVSFLYLDQPLAVYPFLLGALLVVIVFYITLYRKQVLELVRTQESLQQEKDRLVEYHQQLLHNLLEGFLLFRVEINDPLEKTSIVCIDVNKEGELILQKVRSEMIGQRLEEVCSIPLCANLRQPILTIYQNHLRMKLQEIPFRRKDRTYYYDIMLYRIHDSVAVVLRDITVRRESQKALEASEKRYRSFVQNIHGIALQGNFDFELSFIHGNVQEITGYTDDEFLSKEVKWIDIIHPDDVPAIQTFRDNMESLPNQFIEYEYRIITKSGDIRWVHQNIHNVQDDQGKPSYVEGVLFDISDKKQFEEHMLYSQRMEIIGELSEGVAHNLNNLLSGIIGNLSLAKLKKYVNIESYIEAANDSASRATKLVKDLMELNREPLDHLESIHINPIVEEVIELMSETIDRRIKIAFTPNNSLPKLTLDATKIQTVLMNLCLNARDAIEIALHNTTEEDDDEKQVYTIQINTELVVIQNDNQLTHPEGRPGEFVVVSIHDNGIGITEEHQNRIFEPFYSTKETVGCGLGLSSAHGIIRQHNGWIECNSEIGKGTIFTVYFPVSEDTSTSVQSVQSPVSNLRGDATILVIDDEPIIIDITNKILSSYGYTVFSAKSGQKGLELFFARQNQIDLVILDQNMPDFSGDQVFAKIREIQPDIRIILSSGHSIEAIQKSSSFKNLDGLVMKPYTPSDLLEKVQKVLHS